MESDAMNAVVAAVAAITHRLNIGSIHAKSTNAVRDQITDFMKI
jgi:hypothetical protein